MSVTNPGVSSRVPPTAIITPSATSRAGKRRWASASLKRLQAPRPWWRSSSEPSTASASSRARVGRTPIASPDLNDHVELDDRDDDEEDDEQGHPFSLEIRLQPPAKAAAARSSSTSDSSIPSATAITSSTES